MEVLIMLVLLVLFSGLLCKALHDKKEGLILFFAVVLLGIGGALAHFMNITDILIKIAGRW